MSPPDGLHTPIHGFAMIAILSAALLTGCTDKPEINLLITDIYVRDLGRPVADGGLLLINRVRRPGPESEIMAPPDLPIIAVSGATGHTGQEHLLRIAGSLGADEVLTKPFHPEQLNRIIGDLLARRQAGNDQ